MVKGVELQDYVLQACGGGASATKHVAWLVLLYEERKMAMRPRLVDRAFLDMRYFLRFQGISLIGESLVEKISIK
jgi:hypothetical protein